MSETVAGFFFLAAIYLLLTKRFLGFLVPLAALFLTRITGFLTAPMLLVSLAWIALRCRDRRAVWAGFGVIAVYVISFYWGLAFSPHYAWDIYKSKVGIGRASLKYAGAAFVALAALWALFGYSVTRRSKLLRCTAQWISRHRYGVSGCIVAILIAMCVYRGYLLAFTDHYLHHRWYANRWKMAGHGWSSVSYLSTNTLRLLLSSTGLVAFLFGLLIMGAAAFRRSTLAPVVILGTGFSFVFLIGQLTTPITYYFARYLVSEVVPLACICAVVSVDTVRGYLPRGGWLLFPLFGAIVVVSVWPALVGRMSATEGRGLSRAVACVDEVTGPNSVLLIDRQGLAFGSYSYTTPLRLGFGKRTYTILAKDFASNPTKLDALISYFQRKNLEVYLLSSSARWSGRSPFPNVLTLSVKQERLLGRGRLPTRFMRRNRTLRLYGRKSVEKVPPVCRKDER